MPREVGFLIFSGIIPLIKTYMIIGLGYLLARRGLFPPAASRGASEVALNVANPCLIFSSMVVAFNNENVATIAHLLVISVVYMIAGFIGGALIREWFYVPRNFWQGIIVLTTISNWGNLSLATILTVAKQPPFDAQTDPALATSYVSIFNVASMLALFCGGFANRIALDYAEDVPQGLDAERHYRWDEKPIGSFLSKYIFRRWSRTRPDGNEVEKGPAIDVVVPGLPRVPTLSDSSCDSEDRSCPEATGSVKENPHPPSTLNRFHPRSWYARIRKSATDILNPNVVVIIISLPCALVPELKALFVTNGGGPGWRAPDGRAPLSVIYETATAVGGMNVPLYLILLGASFARFKIPRPLSRLPIRAMFAASAVKQIIIPVLGIFLVQEMAKTSFIPPDARAEKFVSIFLAGAPPTINQFIITSIYSPNGEMDTLTAFILVQYVLMFFSSATLTVVSLLLV